MAPGTYTTAPFAPVFRFTIGDGWTNTLGGVGAGQISKEETTKTGFGWATGMIATAESDMKTPEAILGFFASHGGKMSAPAPATIGGVVGSSIDFTLTQDIFFVTPNGGWRFGPEEKVRAVVLDVNGSVVLLMIEVYSPNDFDAEMTAVQPILDSIVWN